MTLAIELEQERDGRPSMNTWRAATNRSILIALLVLLCVLLPAEPPAPATMVFVPAATFRMGSEAGTPDEKPVHIVTVSSFWIATHEVTQKEWRELMGTDPAEFKGDDLPVEQVSWLDAVEYCNRLSARDGLDPCYWIDGASVSWDFGGNGYRLPTEAEWELAARSGGKDYTYAWGDGAPAGNIADESARKHNSGWRIWFGYDDGYPETAPVGSYRPNDLGLYDMAGNVWEWCWDWYDYGYYGRSPTQEPRGPAGGKWRVQRGGSWGSAPADTRVTNRAYETPSLGDHFCGFRLARSR